MLTCSHARLGHSQWSKPGFVCAVTSVFCASDLTGSRRGKGLPGVTLPIQLVSACFVLGV